MQTWYWISILLATLIIPIRNARLPDVSDAVRKTVVQMLVFVLVRGLGCVYVYWRLPR